MPTEPSEPKREMLRHALATLAYRGTKSLRGAPEGFETFKTQHIANTPGQLLAHICDLLDWGLSVASGEKHYREAENAALPWEPKIERFHQALAAFDRFLASEAPLKVPPERLLQGPLADALTHVGQLNLLRRMADSPVKGENYFLAEIEVGRVGPDQALPKREF